MITLNYFRMLPFSWRLYSPDGNFLAEHSGPIYQVATEARSDACLKHYDGCPIGWSVCPAGYAVFRARVPFGAGEQIVFPGLKIKGVSHRAAGRPGVRTVWMEKTEFEQCVADGFAGFAAIEDEFNAIVRNNIHEIRSLNSDIYNAAYRLNHEALPGFGASQLSIAIGRNIEALSEVLAARIKFVDFLANPLWFASRANTLASISGSTRCRCR